MTKKIFAPAVPSIRIDYAYLDRRSVHAQLHGYGDGREKRLERFVTNYKKSFPSASEEEALNIYRNWTPNGFEKIVEKLWRLLDVLEAYTVCPFNRASFMPLQCCPFISLLLRQIRILKPHLPMQAKLNFVDAPPSGFDHKRI